MGIDDNAIRQAHRAGKHNVMRRSEIPPYRNVNRRRKAVGFDFNDAQTLAQKPYPALKGVAIPRIAGLGSAVKLAGYWKAFH